jgi:hypothetical protein
MTEPQMAPSLIVLTAPDPPPAAKVRFRDFTAENTPDPIEFRLDPDTFRAFGAITTGTLQEIGDVVTGLASPDGPTGPDGQATTAGLAAIIARVEIVLTAFDSLLEPESAARFRARAASKTNPVDFRVLLSILTWLIEQYTNRPTEPSSNSSDGQPTGDGGPSSTDGGSPAVSTP